MSARSCVLTIAGSDSSGGAGIQADIKTITCTHAYAASVVTAITAQNTLGVTAIPCVDADLVEKQIVAVFAQQLQQSYGCAVLVKGGHLSGVVCEDVLVREQGSGTFSSKRIASANTHGTGCTLSAAIASYLAQNYALDEAVGAAKHYLTAAIKCSMDWHIGHGHGPVDHFGGVSDVF